MFPGADSRRGGEFERPHTAMWRITTVQVMVMTGSIGIMIDGITSRT